MSPNANDLSRAGFEAELKALLRAYEGREDNDRCIECTGCARCTESTFCKSSKSLVRCHYCIECERCSDSTHSRASKDLLSCNHVTASERCTRSSYLVRCVDCTGCTYCFGCVGLSKKDFHILNQPYDRATYFATAARLSRELGLAR